MRITSSCLAVVLLLFVTTSGCKNSPTSPGGSGSGSGMTTGGGSSGGGGGSTGPANSSISATIDRQPYAATEILAPSPEFTQGVAPGLNVPRLVNVASGERTTGLGLAFSAPAAVGTHRTPTIGVQATLAQLQPYGPGQLPTQIMPNIPQWIVLPPLGGSGVVTVTTLTETTATGTYSFTLVPGPPPSTATGTRTVSGNFSLTFMDTTIQF